MPYPLEVHLVHQADDGSFAVVGIFFDANDSASSPFISALATNLPYMEGTFAKDDLCKKKKSN